MRASHKWLLELSGVDASPQEVADKLTSVGLEVEAIEPKGLGLDKVVVGEVRGLRPHPERDKLRLVTIFDGTEEIEVVCGASNVPDAGGKIIFAQLGAVLPGNFVISERKLGGVMSCGMICSETELELGTDSDGIFVFGDDAAAPGTPVAEALDLVDHIFEIGLTPNRPDCLGHIGIAREVALLFGKSFAAPVPAAPELLLGAADELVPEHPARIELADHWAEGESAPASFDGQGLGPIAVDIVDAERCPRYGAAIVLGVAVRPSPFWLRYRLFCLDVRPISNVVDATNLVLLERGHPIHGFDLGKVRGRKISVRAATSGETMATLDSVERSFTDDDLLICDGEGPVAIAGVMGGAESEISEATSHVLIECAYFDPRSIRRTSRRVGLHTDASHRFERGVDPNAIPAVLARSATLIAELAGGVVVGHGLDVVAKAIAPLTVHIRHARIERVLGLAIEADITERVLAGLGCAVEATSDGFDVVVPTWRPDISREEDLIEEVARIHGYEHIPVVVPHVRPSSEGTARHILFERSLREVSAGAGLNEAVTYAFVAPSDHEAASASRHAVPMANPLSEERSVLRTSLLPGLAQAAGRAQRHQARHVELFELGRTFHPAEGALPLERRWLAILLLGSRDRWVGDTQAYDFFDAKGRLDAIVGRMVGAAIETELDAGLDERAPFLHPRRRALVRAAGVDLGVLGELHPATAEALGLEGRPVFAQISIGSLLEAADVVGVRQARLLPRFPAVTRDIAMEVADEHLAATISAALADAADGLVEKIDLFDLYRGDQVSDGHRSLAFRVTYRDPESTLTDKRVDKAHARLAKAAKAQFAATIR